MSFTEVLRRWVIALAQIIGLGGVLYEAFWEGGKNPFLLKCFIELLLGGGSAAIPWRSLLQGFQFRFEIREPKSSVPTLLIDLGNITPPPPINSIKQVSSNPDEENLQRLMPPEQFGIEQSD